MARRYRLAIIAFLSVAGLAIIVLIRTLPNSSADQSAADRSRGTPDCTTRPSKLVKTPAARQQGRAFGISDPALLGETASQQEADLTAMKAIGVNSIRVDADWSQVQSDGPNSFDWDAGPDGRVHRSRGNVGGPSHRRPPAMGGDR